MTRCQGDEMTGDSIGTLCIEVPPLVALDQVRNCDTLGNILLPFPRTGSIRSDKLGRISLAASAPFRRRQAAHSGMKADSGLTS